MTGLEDILATIFGEPVAATKRASRREAQAGVDQRMADLRYYWEGDDADAHLVRLVIGGIETIMATTMAENPASRLVVDAIRPTISAVMDTVDHLINIGVIRCMALGKPVRGEPNFVETVPPMQAAPATGFPPASEFTGGGTAA